MRHSPLPARRPLLRNADVLHGFFHAQEAAILARRLVVIRADAEKDAVVADLPGTVADALAFEATDGHRLLLAGVQHIGLVVVRPRLVAILPEQHDRHRIMLAVLEVEIHVGGMCAGRAKGGENQSDDGKANHGRPSIEARSCHERRRTGIGGRTARTREAKARISVPSWR